MRLIKMFGLASLAAVAAMAFVGATSASALFSTQLCKVGTELVCPAGQAQTHLHYHLEEGTVLKLLSSLVNVLCLGVLSENTTLGLGNPQVIHTLSLEFTGCGTGSAHNNCTITVEELPLSHVLKIGFGFGIWLRLSGRKRLQCPNLGINCVYDEAESEFEVTDEAIVAEETPTTELGGKFFCPDEGFLDGRLVPLLPTYVRS